MFTFILKRIGSLVIVLIGITLITFIISHVVPGDPAFVAAGPKAKPEQIEAIREEFGLDKPLYQQYLVYISGLIRGDLGQSLTSKRPVAEDIADYFPATLELVIAAMFISLLFAIPIGIISARYRNSLIDHSSRLIALSGVSMPLFWLGILLQLLFYVRLGWLPVEGRLDIILTHPERITGMYILDSILTGNWETLVNSIRHIILPAFTLAFCSLAVITRILRSSMLEVMRHGYIVTARAKGLKEIDVLTKHALKNAMIPTVTVIGLQVGALLAGVFLIEIIFDWPGMGLYAVRSIMELDYFAIMGVTVVIAMVYVLVNFIVDIVYSILDPRISIGERK